MRCVALCACVLLAATGAYAQSGSVGGVGPQSHPWKATKAQFDTYSCTDGGPFEGVIVAVTDAADTTTCPPSSTGTSTVTCQCVDGTWTAFAGASGSGDVTDVGDCATGACFSSVTARHAFLGPVGGGTAAFRALVEADISDLSHTVDTDSNCLDAGVDCLFAGSATEGGPATSALSVSADSVALTADTTGSYVASITSGAGITGGDGGSEGAALTIAATLGTEVVVSELADGTAGQLITWDAAGAPTTVATGGAGEVLTSNGAGAAPTFQAASGGSSAFADLTSGTNTTAAMVVGTGASLKLSGSGSIFANNLDADADGTADFTLNVGAAAQLRSVSTNGPAMLNTSASSGMATLRPNQQVNDGMGLNGGGRPVIVASGQSGFEVTTTIIHIPPEVNAPATCSIGDVYVDSTGAYCACTSTNTWENLTATGACT